MEGSIPGLKKVINKPFPQTIALTINAGIGSRRNIICCQKLWVLKNIFKG
jgi:hypothetical protein